VVHLKALDDSDRDRIVSPETQFTDPAAVEAWDNWFRWREDGALRDLTVDETWFRVASCIARVEGAQAQKWARMFSEAFSEWLLLPDPRLLRVAGTGTRLEQLEGPVAVLNAAAFVSMPGTIRASFDRRRFIDMVSLAVRLLDDVLLCHGGPPARGGLRIGVIGVADALHHLGLAYDSASARKCAGEIASALAEGALQGGVELAIERGAGEGDWHEVAQAWRARGAPAALVDKVSQCGMRHAHLTAIEPQPRLAQLANNVSDALDPRIEPIPARASLRHAPGGVPILAQVELRAAMQKWIDAPIDYPLVVNADPGSEELEALRQLALERGLRPPTVRRVGEPMSPH
jgi:ribonucleoside-diphosphate reductase alpha chain